MSTFQKVMILGILILGIGVSGYWALDNAQEDDESSSTQDITRAPEAVVARGQAIYEAQCASCHGINGEGQNPDNPLAPDETGKFPAPPHNDTGHTWHHDDDLLIKIIRDGGLGGDQFYEMPAFGSILSTSEMNDVLAYIKTMWTDEQRQMQAQTTERVRLQNQ